MQHILARRSLVFSGFLVLWGGGCLRWFVSLGARLVLDVDFC
jgi:hypothetical protein